MLSLATTSDSPSCSYQVDCVKTDGGDHHPNSPASEEVLELPRPGRAFSIREYVFTHRSKDIRVSWPFSDRLLQLFLNHGVKEVLPSFEPVALAKSGLPVSIPDLQFNSQETPLTESVRKEIAVNKVATLFGPGVNIRLAHKLDEPLVSHSLETTDRIPSLTSKKDSITLPIKGRDKRSVEKSLLSLCQKEFGIEEITASVVTTDAPIRITSKFPQKIKPPSNIPASKSIKLSKTSLVVSDKTPSLGEQSEEKRKLIVKSAGEGIAPDTVTVMDSMAPKICPVCKTFSSTSNTTLNAHIDQCLAAESAAELEVADTSRVFKVKPRKMRSMVDICATAQSCTLEELEKRNGLSCATGLLSYGPSTGGGHAAQNKRPRPEFCDDGREVYVDSTGKKVRLLSQFNDVPAVVDGGRGAKPQKLERLKKNVYLDKEQLGLHIGSKALKKGKRLKKKMTLLKLHDAEFQARKESKGKEHEIKELPFDLLIAQDELQKKWMSCKRSAPSSKNKELLSPFLGNENSHLSSGSSAREECRLQENLSFHQDGYTSSHSDSGGSHDTAGYWKENSVDVSLSNAHTPDEEWTKTSNHSTLNSANTSRACIATRRRSETHRRSDSNPLSTVNRDILKSACSRKSPRLVELKSYLLEDRKAPKQTHKLIAEDGKGLQQWPNKRFEPVSSSTGDSRNKQRLRHLKTVVRADAKEAAREAFQVQKSAFRSDKDLTSPSSTNNGSHKSYSGGDEDLDLDAENPVRRKSPFEPRWKGSSSESVDEQVIPMSANEGCVNPISYSSCDEREVRLSDVSTVVSSQTAETNLKTEGEWLQRSQLNKCRDFTESELCLPRYEDIDCQVFHTNTLLHTNTSANFGNPQTVQECSLLNSHSIHPCSAAIWQQAIPATPPDIQGKPSFMDRACIIDALHGEENHAFPSSSTTFASERTKFGRESLRVSIPPNYLLNYPGDQPCCCSRKESISQTHHGSTVSRQTFVPNFPILKGRHMNSSLNSSNRIGAFTTFNYPYATRVDGCILEPPMSRMKSSSAFRNITSSEAFDVSSPSYVANGQSAPSPVLRLMGKNLMVMNKDTYAPDPKAALPNDISNANYPKHEGFSAGPFNLPPFTGQTLSTSPSTACAGFPNVSRNFGNPIFFQSSGLAQDFSGHRIADPTNFGSRVKGDALYQPRRVDRNYGSTAGLAYEMMEKTQSRRAIGPDHISGSPREVIVIEDVPEVDVDLSSACRLSGPKSYQPVLGGMLMHPSAANSNSDSIRFTPNQVPHAMSWRRYGH